MDLPSYTINLFWFTIPINSSPLFRELNKLAGCPYIFLTSLFGQSTLKIYFEVLMLMDGPARYILFGHSWLKIKVFFKLAFTILDEIVFRFAKVTKLVTLSKSLILLLTFLNISGLKSGAGTSKAILILVFTGLLVIVFAEDGDL